MNQSYSSSSVWRTESPRPLHYSVWLAVDQTGSFLLLLAFAATIGILAWHITGSILFGLFFLLLLSAMMWNVFLPIQYELNTDGVVRKVFGRKTIIAWEDIKHYRVRRDGILLFSQYERYSLEAFRGHFLPVPSSLMTEILYRFRFFVDQDIE